MLQKSWNLVRLCAAAVPHKNFMMELFHYDIVTISWVKISSIEKDNDKDKEIDNCKEKESSMRRFAVENLLKNYVYLLV